MPTFILRGRLTREYLASGLAKAEDRQAALAKLCESVGGKMQSMYFTMGDCDFVLIADMPDAEAAGALSLIAAGRGGTQDMVTTQAFTTAETKAMFERAGKVANSYKLMGAN